MVHLSEVALLPLIPIMKIIFLLPTSIISYFRAQKQCPQVDDEKLLIPANVLVEKIVHQEVSCQSIIESYIARIKLVNPLINAVVEDRFLEALKDARAVDQLVSNTKSREKLLLEYPLLGIPITVKESIGVAGMSNSAGLVNAKNKKAESDADAVAAVKRAGAIVLLVSNTPELCLNWETSNKLTGTTCNPYDTRRTSGGSSGGEASLIGSGASLVGLGSDIAGSLRLPAHFCGIFSHKPTAGLVSSNGHYPNSTDVERWSNCFTIGPMARFASDLPLLLDLIVKPEVKADLKLQQMVDLQKVRIFYFEQNENLLTGKVEDEIIDALKKIVEYFRNNHCVEANKLNLKYFDSSMLLSFIPLLEVRGVDDLYYTGSKRNALFELLRYLMGASKSTFAGVMYYVLHGLSNRVISDESHENVRSMCLQLRDQLEMLLGEDGVLICPTFTSSAHYHGAALSKVFDTSYMTVFNAFGLPVSNCPVGCDSKGLPIGLQVIAKRNCDRLTLAVAKEIENALGGWRSIHFNSVI